MWAWLTAGHSRQIPVLSTHVYWEGFPDMGFHKHFPGGADPRVVG